MKGSLKAVLCAGIFTLGLVLTAKANLIGTNFKAIMRLFRRFDQATLMRVFGDLYRWFFDNLQANHLTLDLDSTVMTRYGQ